MSELKKIREHLSVIALSQLANSLGSSDTLNNKAQEAMREEAKEYLSRIP